MSMYESIRFLENKSIANDETTVCLMLEDTTIKRNDER